MTTVTRKPRRPRVQRACSHCGKMKMIQPAQLERKERTTQNVFCNVVCRNTYNNLHYKTYHSGPEHGRYKDGKSTDYRRLATKHLPQECANAACVLRIRGIQLPAGLLDVDHKDSNRAHNALENLQFLCVLCHAAKTRGITWESLK